MMKQEEKFGLVVLLCSFVFLVGSQHRLCINTVSCSLLFDNKHGRPSWGKSKTFGDQTKLVEAKVLHIEDRVLAGDILQHTKIHAIDCALLVVNPGVGKRGR